jgi:pSer/pThr/pTyr-binding forkhead associated (FHA) protein
MTNLGHPCTKTCEQPVAPERGNPLRFELGPDDAPLNVVLCVDGTAHSITKPVTIVGRSPRLADVVLNNSFISMRGAVLRICLHGVTIEDFGSGTSVLVNHMRVADGGTRIFEGDEIAIGVSAVQFMQRK